MFDEAESDPEGFWAAQARALTWFEPFEQVLDWQLPFARWFVGGRLNVAFNCLDRHVESGLGEKVAFYFEGEPGDRRTITYSELLDEVGRCANALRALGIERGDRVAIYMPMIPELPVAMLACARIGAPHSVVFSEFSADALRVRIKDAGARLLVTADGGWRRGRAVELKHNADQALSRGTGSIENVIVVRRLGDAVDEVNMQQGRDHWWHELVGDQDPHSPLEAMDAEDLLFVLYTSGATSSPKGIMHTTGGYLTQVAFTHRTVFDLKAETDVYWCPADVAVVTGHSYVVYGPLANGATSVLYEGTPDFPDRDRWWAIVERYGVTTLYTDPAAISTFMRWGSSVPGAHDLSSLRLLGSGGEPIDPEAWIWYWKEIGGGRCPVVDTWCRTETGAIVIAPLPGITTLKPGSATFPLPGIGAEVVDDAGKRLRGGAGHLTLTRPWPAMLRGIYGDPERYRQTYWSRFEGRYFAGDEAKIDEDGYLWLLGRVGDVMNAAGEE
jgi:acetyl-CoA synthetase